MHSLGLADDDLQEIIEFADHDGDGEINEDEFAAVMKQLESFN